MVSDESVLGRTAAAEIVKHALCGQAVGVLTEEHIARIVDEYLDMLRTSRDAATEAYLDVRRENDALLAEILDMHTVVAEKNMCFRDRIDDAIRVGPHPFEEKFLVMLGGHVVGLPLDSYDDACNAATELHAMLCDLLIGEV